MDKYEIIIIGAGISGLSLAHYCAREGLKTGVIEKSDRVGGTLHSHRFGNIGDFWIELGAHTCYNSYTNLIGIIEDCELINKLISREKVPFKMLVDEHIKSIPSQLNFLELISSIPNILTIRKQGQSVRSYYSKILGSKNYERVLSPAFNAVISQDASDFPADMLFKKRNRRKDIIKKFTLINGLQTIADSISLKKKMDIITGEEVISVDIEKNSFYITTKQCTYESDFLAIATPVSLAANLLEKGLYELSKELSKINVTSVESFGIAIKRDLTVSIPPVAGIIPFSDSFYSVVSRDTVRHDTYRGFTFHFKPGILDEEGKLKRIADVLKVRLNQIEHVATRENIVPSLKVGHDRLISKIDQFISERPLLLTGNYFDGMAIEDCVLRSLKEFLRLKKLMGR